MGPDASGPTGRYEVYSDPGLYSAPARQRSPLMLTIGIVCIVLVAYWLISMVLQMVFVFPRFGIEPFVLPMIFTVVQSAVVLTAGILLIRARR